MGMSDGHMMSPIESLQGEHQRRLYKELLANYNRLERPVVNDSTAILVELGLTLLQIIDVDEKNQVLMTNSWLQLHWTDAYLTWNPDNYPGVQNLRFPSDQIWTPDILLYNRSESDPPHHVLLYNSADERFDATFHTNVLVNASGHCQYIPPGILKSTCYIDVRWFPFDVQKCDLKFGSWTHNGWLLDLQMLEVDTSSYIPNGEWDLVGVPAKRNELYYDCCKEPYPDVTFTVTMRRRTLYYGLNLLIPCVLISGLALLVFLLPADSGEKISLAQYFATTMMIVGMSVVVTVIVLQFHHHDPHGGKMPKWVRVVLLNWCAWFLRMKQPGEEPRRPDKARYGRPAPSSSSASSMEMTPLPGGPPLSQPPLGPCPSMGGTSNGSMNLYFSGYHPVESPRYPPSSDSGMALGPGPHAHGSLSEEAEPGGGGAGVAMGMGPLMPPPPEIQRILEEVSYIAQRFRDQDEAEVICSEWKFAAAVVDRLCLVGFSLFSIICTFTILMSAPNFIEAVSKDFT
ncbi:unnamed protein product [Boreogadus saida]